MKTEARLKLVAPNAKFWECVNGDMVKLTIKPGATISWHTSAPDDEGYFYKSISWTHNIDQVEMERDTGGRDCDGSHRQFSSFSCRIKDLDKNPPNEYRDQPIPQWERGSCSQRDEYAERMGY